MKGKDITVCFNILKLLLKSKLNAEYYATAFNIWVLVALRYFSTIPQAEINKLD